MRIENYLPGKIINQALKLTLTDYENGISRFVEILLDRYPEKSAIYRFGSINTPGISDVDLLIIIDDEKWAEMELTVQRIIQSDNLFSQLFVHPPVIVGESLISSLPFLHTLDQCTFIGSTWDPLKEVLDHSLDKGSLLLRHALWSSYMRYSATKLGAKEVQLREGLLLLNNLLKSVEFGNQLLTDPMLIPRALTTPNIRKLVISADPTSQTTIFIRYLQEIFRNLDLVDEKIDRQLADNMDLDFLEYPLLIVIKNRCLIAPLDYEFASIRFNKVFDWLTRNVSFIRVAGYQCYLPAIIAQNIEKNVEKKSSFGDLSIPVQLKEKLIGAPLIYHFNRILSKKHQLGIPLDSIQRFLFSENVVKHSFQKIQLAKNLLRLN